ncbi:hypothetical protein DFH08DRAFT_291292 [Mycena albidolilacea]|uniref:Uncharacterized protein n=1 Tax=Mycena albidolilacea TaxID=1033008 RepID=A0AAD6ZQZ7_9AGAR|nr:hypothetical protein DFH08DRAFT_291292 [Mycena albidolilacea]
MEKKHEYFMDVIAKRRSGFEAERDRAQKAILEHHKSVLENFDQMTKLLQPNPFPITYQDLTPAPVPTTSLLLPAQRSPKTPQHDASVPAKRPRPESGPIPKSQSDTSAAKRAEARAHGEWPSSLETRYSLHCRGRLLSQAPAQGAQLSVPQPQ